MLVSYNWLQSYFKEKLPEPKKLSEILTMNIFEIESLEKAGGDFVMDVKILPNRAHDCLSHRGIAKEVGTILGLKLEKDFLAKTPEKIKSLADPKNLEVEIENSELCRRYCGAVIKNVEVKESPDWLKEKLVSLGQRPINNIVDATNYVMFDTGQPMHAFDMAKMSPIDGVWRIAVREAGSGEKITALDGKEYKLPEGTLLICDGNSSDVLGIAGIKGGRKAEIDGGTKDIILEAANFNPILTRKTSKKLGLRTDASVRFENEIAPEIAHPAMLQVVNLILEIAGSSGAGKSKISFEGVADIFPKQVAPYKIGISLEEANKILGSRIKEKEVEEIFGKLGFEFKKIKPLEEIVETAKKLVGAKYKMGASVRADAPEYFDCSSFASYCFVQGGISLPRISADQFVFGDPVKKENLKSGDLVFSNSGMGKIHFESQEFMKGTKIPEGVDHVGIYLGGGKIAHSTRYEDKGVVIEDMDKSPSFQNIVGYRRAVRSTGERFLVVAPNERLDLRIKEDLAEELGRIYGYENIKQEPLKAASGKPAVNKIFYYSNLARKILSELGFSEVCTYSLRDKGEVEILNPLASDKNFLRENLSAGLSESLEFNAKYADLLCLDDIKIFEIGKVFPKEGEKLALSIAVKKIKKVKGRKDADELAEALSAFEKKLGVEIASKGRVKENIFEIDFGKFVESLPEVSSYGVEQEKISETGDLKFRPISPFPFAVRDVAVFVPSEISEREVAEIIKKEAGDFLVALKLFDVFKKTSPDGSSKTSYAFRLILQSKEKTLSDENINLIMSAVTKSLNSRAGWQVR